MSDDVGDIYDTVYDIQRCDMVWYTIHEANGGVQSGCVVCMVVCVVVCLWCVSWYSGGVM